MANPEHVAILMQGVEVWNQWRENNIETALDLQSADFPGADLSKINLIGANLFGINLSGADLRGADLSKSDLGRGYLVGTELIATDLREANLIGADLRGANLSRADLREANLIGADLRGANLSRADLQKVNFFEANLSRVDISYTNLVESNLSRADFSEANFNNTNLCNTIFNDTICGETIFTNLDFSTAKGLHRVNHRGPSTVGMDTYFKSKGKIPEVFLRGCGLPETLITFLPSMLEDAIQFYSCFISYSHDDKEFAKRLHDRLQGEGIRCWLDEHQLNPGDVLHQTISDAIRVYDKVILCCSETALKSWWVEREFNHVIAKEEAYKQPLLIPVTLDSYLFGRSKATSVKTEIKQRLVQDFVNWKDHDAFEQSFASVVKALRTDGGKLPDPKPKIKKRR